LYFQVLEKADLCMLLNYNLWVDNALNPDYQKNDAHRTENEWEVKRLIKNCNYQVIMNYRRLLNQINRDQRVTGETSNIKPTATNDVAESADAVTKPKASKKTKTETAPESLVAA
jgi:hypothetical protein